MEEAIAAGYIANIHESPPEPYFHTVLQMCGDAIERYEEIMTRVPFFRVLTWAERKLRDVELQRRAIEEMKAG